MKADGKTQSEVTAALVGLFEAYNKRDLKGMLAFAAPDADVLVIGSGQDERSIGAGDFGKSSQRDWGQSEAASVNFKDPAVSMAGSVSWLAADAKFQFTMGGKESILPGRLTAVLEKRNGKWLLMQMHFSVASRDQEQGQSWPKQNVPK